MRKLFLANFMIFALLLCTVSSALGGGRYHSHSYNNYHHYNHYYKYRNYHYDSGDAWALFGISLLTGIVVGAIINQPHPQQKVVYTNAPPTYQQTRVVTYRQPAHQIVPQPEQIVDRVKTNVDLLNIRNLPGYDAKVTGQIIRGTILDVIGAAPEWLYVKTPSGQYGWVDGQYTQGLSIPAG